MVPAMLSALMRASHATDGVLHTTGLRGRGQQGAGMGRARRRAGSGWAGRRVLSCHDKRAAAQLRGAHPADASAGGKPSGPLSCSGVRGASSSESARAAGAQPVSESRLIGPYTASASADVEDRRRIFARSARVRRAATVVLSP